VQYDLPNAASDSYLITEYNLVNQTSTNFTVNSVGLGTLQGLYTSGELIFTDQNYIQIYDTATNNVVGQ
jgi:hypothetical protein